LCQRLAIQVNNSKKKEVRFTSNVNCGDLGKALLAALVKLSKRMQKLYWKILFWMYGSDKLLRVQPRLRSVPQEDWDIYRVESVQSVTSGVQTRILIGRNRSFEEGMKKAYGVRA